jgi:hypothetical protein
LSSWEPSRNTHYVTRLFKLAAERGVHLGSLTRGLIDLLDTHGAAALEAALLAALPAVRHFIDLQRARRGACPPIPVTLPNDPRVRASPCARTN